MLGTLAAEGRQAPGAGQRRLRPAHGRRWRRRHGRAVAVAGDPGGPAERSPRRSTARWRPTRRSATSRRCSARPPRASSTRSTSLAEVTARHGRRLLIDAMSAFGALPLDAGEVAFDGARGVGQQVPRRGPGRRLRDRPAERARGGRGQRPCPLARSPRPVDQHGADRAVALHAADPRARGVRPGAPASTPRRAASKAAARAIARTAGSWSTACARRASRPCCPIGSRRRSS